MGSSGSIGAFVDLLVPGSSGHSGSPSPFGSDLLVRIGFDEGDERIDEEGTKDETGRRQGRRPRALVTK